MTQTLLTLNAGSSSLKFALFEIADAQADLRASGQIEGMGSEPHFIFRSATGDILQDCHPSVEEAGDHAAVLDHVLAVLGDYLPDAGLCAVGHRVVHGGPNYASPIQVTSELLAELQDFTQLAPLHQPHNLAGIAAAQAAFPHAIQVACFDTAFHRSHPWVNDTFALPRKYYDKGVRRYGFHGLSYEYVTRYLQSTAPQIAAGRVVVAHLGSGASMCAIRNGLSIGSTMGFSALDGLPMGTRCGQLDPGVVLYLLQHEALTPREVSDVLYKDSGLKGLSGLSNDMRLLEAAGTPEAQQAIDYFVFRIRREVGAMAAILGGLDALVFCGGIGENAHLIRQRICHDMDWLGLQLDESANSVNSPVISSEQSRIKVLVVRTDEEAMIARHTLSVLHDANLAAELVQA
jgi:acetate kinase